jgi:hypothetical protein
MNDSSDGISDEDGTIINSSDSDFEGAVKSMLQFERSWQGKAAMFASMDASGHRGRHRNRAGNERRCRTFLGLSKWTHCKMEHLKRCFVLTVLHSMTSWRG